MPAGMAELQHPQLRWGQQRQKVAQPAEVELLVWRELKEHRTELGAQVPGPVHEQGDLVAYLAEPLDMGDVAAGLYCKPKIGRSGVPPTLEHFSRRQAIERVVQFYG
jgi:hypothetical protein